MSRMRRTRQRIASVLAVSGIVAGTVLGGAASASASGTATAPPGYAGPFPECKGTPLPPLQLAGISGYVFSTYAV